MKRNYKKLLNKKDPTDREILRLAKEKKLKVGVTELGRFTKMRKPRIKNKKNK